MIEPAPPLEVALLALPETTPGTLYGLAEVLGAAGTTWSQLTGEPEIATRRIAPRIVSRDGASFRSRAGPPIAVDRSCAEAADAEVVVVTAVDLDGDPRGRWPSECDYLRERHATGTTIASVCTGSLALAEAGLLDGLEATTHWAAAPLFRKHYPQVRLRPERVLCPAGPEHRIVTSGGAASWADLALWLVARACGEGEALRLDRAFLLGDRSDGQLPFAAMMRPRRHEDVAIAAAQEWIADHYAEPHPVAGMAARSRLSERTFKRRFKAATGYAPVAYVQAIRIEEAKHLLETSALPTDAVAAQVGYEDPASFRRLFKRATGVSPARYRRRLAIAVGRGGRGGRREERVLAEERE
ncbi:GlxA family transcriptional regulator [Salinarimonas rosea]|uniref:GlxA family transcriptional regulator n=1 Tax=Salinarimonas rosea TaxID=552063 RepID=UPI0004166AD5|nr:helix-turn-helix domain-containing protein [Salinarimonas rosea]